MRSGRGAAEVGRARSAESAPVGGFRLRLHPPDGNPDYKVASTSTHLREAWGTFTLTCAFLSVPRTFFV